MKIKALLLDIDGTMVFKGHAIPGAAEAIEAARMAGLQLRFLTNITGQLPSTIAEDLQRHGINVRAEEIHTASTSCARYLKSLGDVSCFFLMPESVNSMFEGIARDHVSPDVVVIGDIGESFDYACLNQAFGYLHKGARLVVPHKNLFWFDPRGVRLDCGAFILGLEAASGKQALVTGKPSPVFFTSVMDSLGVKPSQTMIIGDDLLTDIAAAQHLEVAHALVLTGKGASYTESDVPRPERLWPSIAELSRFLAQSGHNTD
ncbi:MULTISPECIES: HAD-IIA family hydrolase [Pseudomonas]|nr:MULTISPECIES: HAD-IIA family hydrolase [Pseudomonas]EPM91998.1 HAD superfamily hydrolase [Pseudomonas syringae pv. actinidiae ICMP 19070]KPB82603.1 Ptx16 [Pseudomonas syringae pv. maculicola]AAZ37041.1 hydrolase, HAD-superfamily, subfamily IIA [Pseudomonas savastanoi pv. phaseolicola 1448A]AQL39527.1 HAD family hydrolase [Pseudomonas syringae pv. actinidiae ICMP 9853]EGH66959.1 HAD superfamily hydrolase [Pseudomonas syringae pv. actinidiae str. M302091]